LNQVTAKCEHISLYQNDEFMCISRAIECSMQKTHTHTHTSSL